MKDRPSDLKTIYDPSSRGELVGGSFWDPQLRDHSKRPTVMKCTQKC